MAGNGSDGYSGDDGAATSASLSVPFGISVTSDYVYIADTNNHVIRYSRIHSLTHSLTYLLSHSLTHSLTHPFTYLLTYLLMYSGELPYPRVSLLH